ncbi:WD-40 repeat protein [Reticulomyxa filosa]|uniref:WD-40 repeat protein n=1 Tax=Reticulomyxa filosa TaxID=46433 RepID=X6M159_RETFI|nr:WD-40 repeat protein [Reticulomyxa filosa]|eukprot:ETO07341.1 WD-40 repeat protein [Reticulomyxa filosa]
MTKLFVYGMLKHQNHYILSMVIQIMFGVNNNNGNKSNNIGVIGGNGYTFCSGSGDKTICMWDIETTKQLTVFKGHEQAVGSVKYGSNELGNTILSGSDDNSVRLWDIRSGQQIQVFDGHKHWVLAVEYLPFSSNVICSGSRDNTIRFWDIRSNKNELYMIKGDEKDDGIYSLKFISLKKKEKDNGKGNDFNLCFGSATGNIRVWG